MISAGILLCLLNVFVLATGDTVHHYYWRDYHGYLPNDGISFSGIFVAQIPGHDGVLPASFYPETQEAVSEVFGKKLVKKKGIKILCDPNVENFYWEYTTTDELSRDKSDNKVAGGIEGDILLFIGRIFHEGVWKISKIIPPDSEFKGFKGWNNLNGTQYNSDDFQILKYKKNAIAPRC